MDIIRRLETGPTPGDSSQNVLRGGKVSLPIERCEHTGRTGSRGGRILHRKAVKLLADPVRIGEAVPDDQQLPVELVREQDVIRQIKIACSCGQMIVLECVYPEDERH